jgi:hypothetical protein
MPRKPTNTQAAMKYIKLFDQSIWPIGDIKLEVVTEKIHEASLDRWRHKKRLCDGSLYQLGLIISGPRMRTTSISPPNSDR